MKPQELRIGDYVRIKGGKIVQVKSITRRHIGYLYGKHKTLMYSRYSEIEPVPIREVYTSLPSIPELMWNDWVESGNLYQYGNIPIKYLHELQNIHYALTGNEIEIEI